MDFIAPRSSVSTSHPPLDEEVAINIEGVVLAATLTVPHGARAVVVLLARPGGSRFDSRSTFFGRALQQVGLATLLLEPYVEGEPVPGDAVAARVAAAVDWLGQQPATSSLKIGLLAPAGAGALAAASPVAALVYDGPPPLVPSAVPHRALLDVPFERAVEQASEFFVEQLVERG